LCHSAADDGGGISNYFGTVTVQQSTLSGNGAGSPGGIFNAASGTLTVDDSVVCGKIAPLGADLGNLGVVTLNDSTVCVTAP
jgi:hypothetical protein